jgi:hypothetical protein
MTNSIVFYFEYLGAKYRKVGMIVERLDGSTWNKTGSLRVILEAKRIEQSREARD